MLAGIVLTSRNLTEKANKNIDPILADLTKVAESTKESVKKIDAMAEDISKVTNPRSPLLLKFQNLLHDTERASQQLQELANDLKRNPSTLLRGKKSE